MGASRGLVLRAQVEALRWQRLCIMGAGRGLAPHPHIFSSQSNGDEDVDKISRYNRPTVPARHLPAPHQLRQRATPDIWNPHSGASGEATSAT